MNHRILIVDDDVDDIHLLYEAFSSKIPPTSLSFMTNPEGVMDYLDAVSAENLPTLIITDFNMPKLSGMQLLQVLKENRRYQDIDTVIISTAAHSCYMKRCLEQGAKAYFIKPQNVKGYEELVDKVVRLFN